MNTQRLRNLTTRRLHTKMEDIYEDIEFLTGEKGIMTHMLPNALLALEPWLKDKAPDPRLWEDKADASHTGEVGIEPMNTEEKTAFWKRFKALPSPLFG